MRDKIQELRETMKGEADAETIKTKASEVQQTAFKVFEVAYKQKAASNSDPSKEGKDDVHDADFEDVKDKKK